jgi:hypothetical protein
MVVVMKEAAKNRGNANRERRLGAALRENLKRRKAQARARSADAPKPIPVPAHDSAGISEEDDEEG